MATVTESVVDAKDEGRQAEARTDIASALLEIEKGYNRLLSWLHTMATGILLTVIGVVASIVLALIDI